jgi:hypothetical protein
VLTKKDGSTNIQKNIAAIVQNEQIYSKKSSFALLLLTNPLPLTIINNLSMKVVGIGCLLSLTLGQQQVIIMAISMIFFFFGGA